MARLRVVALACIVSLLARPALAFNAEGHMAVAAVAYQRLKPATRKKVNALLKLNPKYTQWSHSIPVGVPVQQYPMAIFMMAATWPDEIKKDAAYISDGTDGGNRPPNTPEASQNIGYSDRFMHKYWHFLDTPFGAPGLPLPQVPVPNAQDRIELFLTTLASNAPDALKSYDLSWLLHIIGDVHQPLHASTRVTAGHDDGDAGGNLVIVCPPAGCPPKPGNLHSVWDQSIGTDDNVKAALAVVATLPAPKAQAAKVLEPAKWMAESFELAQSVIYVAPIGPALGPYTLNQTYLKQVRKIGRERVALAGARLAAVLEQALK